MASVLPVFVGGRRGFVSVITRAFASKAARRHAPRMSSAPPIIGDANEWFNRMGARVADGYSQGYFAFYSSVSGAITTRTELMVLPIDDHMVVRGHAVFDTCSLKQGRLYRLGIHMQRFLDSAQAVRLPLPFGDTRERNAEAMSEIIKHTVAASGAVDADVRYWLSAGPGNLGITPTGCKPGFYVLVYGGLPTDPSWQTNGVHEATVPEEEVPMKPKLLAEAKSNNYLLNALTMMKAQDRGGTFGIAINKDGYITESCVLNVAVLCDDGVLRTPPFEKILAGTTIRRVMELLTPDVGSSLLKGIEQVPVSLEKARSAAEIFLCAGDTHVYPVIALDGKPVGDGIVGPLTTEVISRLNAEAQSGNSEHHEVLP